MATEEIIAHSDVDLSFNPQVLQQQEVQQQDYQLTLKDLCNQWFTKLTSKNGNKKLDIMNSARCIVGEAYKFSENRIYNNDQEYVYGCRPCAEIAAEFIDLLVYPKEGNRDKEFDKQMDDNGFVTEDVLNNNKLVRKFLAHWSRDHINI